MGYQDIKGLLPARPRLGLYRKKVRPNTYLEAVNPDEEIKLLLYGSEIMTFRPDSIRLDVGRWKTPLTRDRINSFLNTAIRSTPSSNYVSLMVERGGWYLYRSRLLLGSRYMTTIHPFCSGMTISYTGDILSYPEGSNKYPYRKRSRLIWGASYLRMVVGTATVQIPLLGRRSYW